MKLLAILRALIDTAERTTDLDHVYNDKLMVTDDNNAFSWDEVYEVEKNIGDVQVELYHTTADDPALVLYAPSAEVFDEHIDLSHDSAPIVICKVYKEGRGHGWEYDGTYYDYCKIRMRTD